MRLGVLVFIVAIAGACGDIDDGSWSPMPAPTSPISAVSPSTPAAQDGVKAHGTEMVPGVTPTLQPDRSYWIRCDLAPASPIDIDMAGQPVAVHQDQVCFNDSTLCQQTLTYEAHATSLASCWALNKIIAARSKDRLGDHWAAKVMPLLPAVWSTTVAQVNSLSHRISGGMVDLITGGSGLTTAAGSPLCFPTYGAKTELATTTAVNQVTSLVNGTENNVQLIKSALSRGLDVQVDYDFRLQLAVKFGELSSSPIEPLQCDFTK